MTMIDALRAPLVTETDRKWSLDQCPPWASRATPGDDGPEIEPEGESIDETDMERARRRTGGTDRFVWDWFVDDQIHNFERFFAHERKSFEDWSRLWRRSWWPKADPKVRVPRLVAKLNPGQPHPFARRGSPEFEEGLRLATPQERRLFERIGVVQFPPDDNRAKVLA